MKRLAIALAAVLFFAACPVGAAETYDTMLSGDAARPASHVMFHASCGDECFAASLDCDDTGAVSFEFGDVEAKIAAAAMTRKGQDFAVKIGGASFSFVILNLKYGGEMYGTWLVTGALPGTSQAPEFTAALGKAKEFKASVGNVGLTLPVTADVKTWASACGK